MKLLVHVLVQERMPVLFVLSRLVSSVLKKLHMLVERVKLVVTVNGMSRSENNSSEKKENDLHFTPDSLRV